MLDLFVLRNLFYFIVLNLFAFLFAITSIVLVIWMDFVVAAWGLCCGAFGF